MAKRRIPHFATDEEAAEFWDTHVFTDYWDDMEPADDVRFPHIKLKQISLRLAPTQIERLKRIAAGKGIGYQTMIRMWITERVRREAAPANRATPRRRRTVAAK
jgi:predicted DNA binding CopG/RHH family protein